MDLWTAAYTQNVFSLKLNTKHCYVRIYRYNLISCIDPLPLHPRRPQRRRFKPARQWRSSALTCRVSCRTRTLKATVWPRSCGYDSPHVLSPPPPHPPAKLMLHYLVGAAVAQGRGGREGRLATWKCSSLAQPPSPPPPPLPHLDVSNWGAGRCKWSALLYDL